MSDRAANEPELEARAALSAALGRLPAEQREAIELAAGAGMSYRQIAERTGVAGDTVQRQINRGLRALRVALRDVPYFSERARQESDRS